MPSPNSCGKAGCSAAPVAQWRRRPTAAELAAIVQAEQARRDQIRLLADPAKPAPSFGPLPSAADTVVAVFGCADHSIALTQAALVHAAGCTAPDAAHLPGCGCTPEPAPSTPVPVQVPTTTLPTGWIVAAAPAAPVLPAPAQASPSHPTTAP